MYIDRYTDARMARYLNSNKRNQRLSKLAQCLSTIRVVASYIVQLVLAFIVLLLIQSITS